MSARENTELGALIALFAGAMSTGAAGVLVRLADTGPTATAFWRGLLALPFLALWALFESNAAPSRVAANATALVASFRDPRFLWPGVFFAGDLALWHWSLLLTSIAASTLEASLAPLIVTLVAWLWWRERPSSGFLLASGLAFTGMLLIVSPKFGQGGAAYLGDALGLGTACFFAAYLLAVARLRARYSTGIVMFNLTVVFTLLLLPLALTQKFLPETPSGWGAVLGCALAAQVIGQGLIAYALAHLRPSFSALGLLVQTLGAALAAWLVLGERLTPIQILGAVVVVGGIALARASGKSATAASKATTAAAAAASLRALGD